MEKNDIFELLLVDPLLAGVLGFEGGDRLGMVEGVAGWRGKTMPPPPGEKRLLGGRDKSIYLKEEFYSIFKSFGFSCDDDALHLRIPEFLLDERLQRNASK